MGLYINKGNAGFASVCGSRFVDKSMLIDKVNCVLQTESRFMCVTRARRFGKSVAVKMLNAYYDKSCDSSKLFENLQICKTEGYKKHLNQYPVIYLDMTDFLTKYGNVANLVEKIKQDITNELLSLYDDVKMSDGDDLMDLLTKIVSANGQPFICLIDEWDALCREGAESLMDAYVDLLRRLFKGSNTESVFACVYMTGILPIKRYNTQSALNNFEEYTMLSPADLASYFGFTETEVEDLCQSSKLEISEMKRWYDGYEVGDEKAIYNPYAVIRALKRNRFENYWTSTNTFESLKQYLTMNFEGLKDDVVRLLADVPVEVNHLRFSNDMHRIGSKDDVLTLLCHLGYLSYNWESGKARIPNYEVRHEFEMAIADTHWSEVQKAESAISQIKRQNYVGALSSFSGEVILVGINYDKKDKLHTCQIEQMKVSSVPGNTKSNTKTKGNTRSNANVEGMVILTEQQQRVLEYCKDQPHTALEIFHHLSISKQAKHYKLYVDALLQTGHLLDTTPESKRDKRYLSKIINEH